MVGVGGSSPLATTIFKKAVLVTAFLCLKEMDETTEGGLKKLLGIKLLLHLIHSCHPWQSVNFEQTLVWPEGRGQDSPSSPLATARAANVPFISNAFPTSMWVRYGSASYAGTDSCPYGRIQLTRLPRRCAPRNDGINHGDRMLGSFASRNDGYK